MRSRARKWAPLAAGLFLAVFAAEDVIGQRGGRASGEPGGGRSSGSVRHAGTRPATKLRSSTVPGARLPGGYGSVRHASGVQGGNRVSRVGARDNRATLPEGSPSVEIKGRSYHRVGNGCYVLRTVGGQAMYAGIRPPPGWWLPTLPECPRWRWGDRWVYYWDDCYWEESEQDGESGYVVIEDLPAAPEEFESNEDPHLYLTRASEFLGRFEKISLEVNETMDELNEDGMEVELSTKRRVWMRRSHAMKVDSNGDRGWRYAFYNGQSLTIFDAATKEYGVADVPGDIDGMLDEVAQKFDTVIPLADLLASSMVDSLTGHNPEGTYLGQHRVRNYKCDHLSFTGETVDFEIWIESGNRPVPRKFNITYKTLHGKPRYEAELYRWNMTARVTDRTFEFRPPAGAKRIDRLPGETVQFAEPE